jgi:hypothetical protein
MKFLNILFLAFLFRNALSDGKRAIVLKNTWPKVSFFYSTMSKPLNITVV